MIHTELISSRFCVMPEYVEKIVFTGNHNHIWDLRNIG